MSIFSERIKGLRDSREWSKSKTAQKLGVSPQRYSNWEYGLHEPDFEMLSQIAKLFDTTTDFLTGKTNNPAPDTNEDEEIIDIDKSPVTLAYDGTVATDDDMEIIKSIIARHKRNKKNE